jgi:surfeit locus 1 family protein
MLPILIGLGTWQVERLRWKTALLAELDRSAAEPPVALSENPRPFTRVRVQGRFVLGPQASLGAEVRPVGQRPEMGARVIAVFTPESGPPLLLDRGWAPSGLIATTTPPAGIVTIEAYVHPGERPGWFAAADDPATRRFYTFDPVAIGKALGIQSPLPFSLVALGAAEPGQFPQPARAPPRPPNNHLIYALTWYGFAIILVVIFVLWSRKGGVGQ